MVLAQEWRKEKYKQFYLERKKNGDKIILDNGVYEGEIVKSAALIDVINELQPDIVVAYDSPNSYQANIDRFNYFIDEVLLKTNCIPKVMGVVHAQPGRWDSYVQSYLTIAERADVIGISRLTKRFGLPNERRLPRSQVLEVLANAGLKSNKPHHALGLSGGSNEAADLHDAGFDSCDTASPVWRGFMGYNMYDEWPDIPMDMDYDIMKAYPGMKSQRIDDTLHLDNLSEVMKACGY